MRVGVFLRGINVGGNKKIPMAALRDALSRAGHADVKTLLQSGNVVLDKAKPAELEKLIEAEFGMTVRVIVRTHAELVKVIEDNPFKEHLDQPSRLAVAFLEKAPAKVTIDPAAYAPDEFLVRGKDMYLWYPNGMGVTKMGNPAFVKGLGVAMTVRNWNTVTKMADLTQ
jgi:uncharacterized protein (DUF1697 family)